MAGCKRCALKGKKGKGKRRERKGKRRKTSSPKGNDRSPESHYTCCKFALKLFTIPTRILSMMMCIQNFVSFCQFVLKILSKNRILTSIKGSNSVAKG